MIIGSTTVNLGSDALNQAFYNEVYDSNGNPRSPLLLNLLQTFTGTIVATSQTGGFTNGSTITLSSAMLPGSGDNTQELSWSQFAVVIAHELGHAVLPYGAPAPGSNYVKDAINPATSILFGERNESVANAAECKGRAKCTWKQPGRKYAFRPVVDRQHGIGK
jgi:hypothetical protein